jgi:hypothetical protein
MPQQAPAVRPQQPVTSVKPSNVVSQGSLGVPAAAAQAGQGLGVQALYAPSALPPVAPTGEAPKVEPEKNAAAPEKVGLAVATTVGLARSPVAEAALGGPEKHRERHVSRGKLLPRERWWPLNH